MLFSDCSLVYKCRPLQSVPTPSPPKEKEKENTGSQFYFSEIVRLGGLIPA